MRRAIPVLLLLMIACGPFFDEAPPSLGSYPERVATKRWDHLFKETSPLDPTLPDEPTLDGACHDLLQTLAPLDTLKRLAEIDLMLNQNRSGPYSARRANFLHELRELVADPAVFDAAKSYLTWRAGDGSTMRATPPEQRPWNMEEAQFKSLHEIYQTRVAEKLAEIDQIAAAAPRSMKPYWMVRRAAFLFEQDRYADAETDFAAVVSGFPAHPRAEVASLMRARCKIEQSRVLGRAAHAVQAGDGQENPDVVTIRDLQAAAEELLKTHVSTYAKGRFTPDAEGWLGGIAYDRKKFGAAVKQQLARVDRQPTRETTRSVLRECDAIFGELLKSCEVDANDSWLDAETQFDAAAVATHPLVARLFVQYCIDPAADVSIPLWWDERGIGGQQTLNFLNRRIFKPAPLVRLALRELGKELLSAGSKQDATTLTLLAWAATGEGEHEQALALLDRVAVAAPSDEALHARAIILQRLERHADAVAAFDTLAKAWPDSPLAADLVYRRSVSLFKCGRSGSAIADIAPVVFLQPVKTENEDSIPSKRMFPSSQLIQWLDTLVQFSPLDQLQSAFAAVPANSLAAGYLRNAIRTRALAAERFDLAAQHLAGETDVQDDSRQWLVSRQDGQRLMTRKDWETRAAPLAELYAKLGAAGNEAEMPALHLAIARLWMENRGLLTLPAVELSYYAESEEEKQDQLRRRNALELGFTRDAVNRELDHHDEATHALEHALEAAKSQDSAIAAPALELANQCLFRRAEFSLYQKSRALETDDTRLSQSLYRQLIDRFPTSPEAKRSVYFTFSPAAGPWMPGDYNPANSASALMRALMGKSDAQDNHHGPALEKIAAILARVDNPDPKTPLSTIRKNLDAAKREIAALRAGTDPDEQNDVVAAIIRLDDLSAAASLKDIRATDFLSYVKGETEHLPPSFRSLLDYKQRLQSSTDDTGADLGPKNDTVDGWRSFLDLYPDSPKAEAASFRMTRLIARQYRTSRKITAVHFPEAPMPGGYKHLEVFRVNPETDPDAVLYAIREHEKRFPMGRYLDDLNLLRAGTLIDSGNFADALVLLDGILENSSQRDLHVIAALEFADIAQRLLDPAQRTLVAKALKSTPGAFVRLRLLADGDTFLSRLQPLMPWLEKNG